MRILFGTRHAQRFSIGEAAACVAALLVFLSSGFAHAQDDPYVVRTTAGLLRGQARSAGGAEFLGVPYAEPPTGELRWSEPSPRKPWTGVRDAKAFGSPCAQPVLGDWNRPDAETGSEDCLYLNVIAPDWPAKAPLPVMFWIHGGANLGGSGSGDLYNRGTLTAHGVLLVTMNYRLGVFGFFAHPALTAESPHHASGNWGLMDQVLALHWVRDNIASFGGDPNNITVFGQSAGSMDIGMLMTSPLAAGLFDKAIEESGAAFSASPVSLANAEHRGVDTIAALNLPAGAQGVAALREIPSATLLKKLGSRADDWPGFGPDIDGWVLSRSPADVFSKGGEAPVALLIGTTSREFGSSEPPDQLRLAMTRVTGDLAPQALALYGIAGRGQGTKDPLYGTASDQWSADIVFHCPISTQALWHAAAHHPTYEYEFDHAIPGQEAQGAVHSAELPYVFGFFPKSGDMSGNFGPIDLRLADLMERYWTSFAKTGDPNGDGLTKWPQVEDAQRYLSFTEDGQALASNGALRGPQCELYRNVLRERAK